MLASYSEKGKRREGVSCRPKEGQGGAEEDPATGGKKGKRLRISDTCKDIREREERSSFLSMPSRQRKKHPPCCGVKEKEKRNRGKIFSSYMIRGEEKGKEEKYRFTPKSMRKRTLLSFSKGRITRRV